jgi:hypothetical protein
VKFKNPGASVSLCSVELCALTMRCLSMLHTSLLLSPHVGQSLALLLFFALRVASSPYAVVRGYEEGHAVGFANMLDGIFKGRVWVDVLV